MAAGVRSLPSRTCQFVREDGSPCRSAPMKGEPFCFWHSPAHTEEAAEARRLGGLRRRRERTVAGAYEFAGLGTVADIRRLLEVAHTPQRLTSPCAPRRPPQTRSVPASCLRDSR